MKAFTSGWSRRDVPRKRPRSAGMVMASPTRCSSDDAAAPDGWTPRADHRELVRVTDEHDRRRTGPEGNDVREGHLARFVDEQDVERVVELRDASAATAFRRRRRPFLRRWRSRRPRCLPTRVTPSRCPTCPSSSSAFWTARTTIPSRPAAAITDSRRLLMVLCDCAVIATRRARWTRSAIMWPPV